MSAASVSRRWNPALHGLYFSDATGLHNLNGGAVEFVRMDLVSEAGDDAGLLRHFHHLAILPDIVRHRLLAVDVLAELHRADRTVGVHVVRGRNGNGIDLVSFFRKHFPEVLVDRRLGAELFHVQGALRIDIAKGDILLVVVGRHRLDVTETFSVGPDRSELQFGVQILPADNGGSCSESRSSSSGFE